MRKDTNDIGSGPVPPPRTAEDAARQHFYERITLGNWAPGFPIERWRPDQRERFERELERLENERLRQREEAREFAARR
jgi:hypothetical protein